MIDGFPAFLAHATPVLQYDMSFLTLFKVKIIPNIAV
jgi:hypothetical protein